MTIFKVRIYVCGGGHLLCECHLRFRLNLVCANVELRVFFLNVWGVIIIHIFVIFMNLPTVL